MIFGQTPIHGAYVVEIERNADDRGFFARTFCTDEFAAAGLTSTFLQFSVSYNVKVGTLRGMHYQVDPHGEVKLVRCTAGEVFDAIVDLRPKSPSYLKWFGINLSARARNALYIPTGVAHGFITLADDTELFYMIDRRFVPEAARGARWDDPTFAIDWPCRPSVISDRDATYGAYRP